jgi:hypothetical protein
MLFIFPFCILQALLFVTSDQQDAWEKAQSGKIEQTDENAPLILNGILYHANTNEWIVWINGQAISSSRPKSIHGWTVTHVSTDTVTLRSHAGEMRHLMVEQMNEDGQSANRNSVEERGNDVDSIDENPDENLDAGKDPNESVFDEVESIDEVDPDFENAKNGNDQIPEKTSRSLRKLSDEHSNEAEALEVENASPSQTNHAR